MGIVVWTLVGLGLLLPRESSGLTCFKGEASKLPKATKETCPEEGMCCVSTWAQIQANGRPRLATYGGPFGSYHGCRQCNDSVFDYVQPPKKGKPVATGPFGGGGSTPKRQFCYEQTWKTKGESAWMDATWDWRKPLWCLCQTDNCNRIPPSRRSPVHNIQVPVIRVNRSTTSIPMECVSGFIEPTAIVRCPAADFYCQVNYGETDKHPRWGCQHKDYVKNPKPTCDKEQRCECHGNLCNDPIGAYWACDTCTTTEAPTTTYPEPVRQTQASQTQAHHTNPPQPAHSSAAAVTEAPTAPAAPGNQGTKGAQRTSASPTNAPNPPFLQQSTSAAILFSPILLLLPILCFSA